MSDKTLKIPIGRRVRRAFERHRTPTIIEGESMTQQQFEQGCNINYLVARYQNTGMLPPGNAVPVYADVTGLQGDLTELHNQSQEKLGKFEEFAHGYKEARPESTDSQKSSTEGKKQGDEQSTKQKSDGLPKGKSAGDVPAE